MRTLLYTVGLPASGKSTWAREQLQKEHGRWKRVNRDDLRMMFHNMEHLPEGEDFITKTEVSLVSTSLKEGYDVIVDATHLSGRSRSTWHKLAEQIGDVSVIQRVFPTSLAECLLRNSKRDRKVPEDVIQSMYKKYLKAGFPTDNVSYYEPMTFVPANVITQALLLAHVQTLQLPSCKQLVL